MPNLNYPDYSQGFGGYSAYKPQEQDHTGDYASGVAGGGASGAAAGTAVLPGWGTLIGAIAGAGLGAYGAYDKSKQGDQNYSAQMAEYERQRRMQAEEVARQKEQDRIAALYAAANHVGSEHDRLMAAYAPYYRSIGA